MTQLPVSSVCGVMLSAVVEFYLRKNIRFTRKHNPHSTLSDKEPGSGALDNSAALLTFKISSAQLPLRCTPGENSSQKGWSTGTVGGLPW
jgi:hypothetical protein